MLQEIILIIDYIALTLWDIRIIQELFYAVNQTKLFISTDTIMPSLINITIIFPHNTSTFPDIYYLNKTLKVSFIILI